MGAITLEKDRQDVEAAKEEAKKNLSGEALEKCLKALDNWLENCGGKYRHPNA